MVQSWLMDSSEVDLQKEHRQEPNIDVTIEELRDIHVLCYHIGVKDIAEVESIAHERKYQSKDEVICSTLNQPKLKAFSNEHIHEEEQIRYVLNGSGFFDVRNKKDQWVRIAAKSGDLLIMPAGIYHRFIMDENNYIHALRMFKGQPIWSAHYRPTDDHSSRRAYVASLTSTVA